MGLIARTFRNIASPAAFAPLSVSPWQNGRAQLADTSYETFAREGYSKNELVYACIEELATSASEPRMHARRGTEWTLDGPALDLLRRPNPFMDAFEFWATVILHRSIAGNAYALKIRSASGRVLELWLMRPDRVRVVADSEKFISHYEYDVGGGEVIPIPVKDVIHFKTRNPLSEFYGMPPLMAASARVDIDNYMRDFVKAFFVNAGVPSGLLAVKNKLNDETKTEIKRRFRHQYGGQSGWHDLLVIDQSEASFTPLTQNLGPSGLVVPNLDEINEARIAMVFGVPLTIIGARLGVNSSSYANKRSDRESFWDEHLAPLYKELAGRLNLGLLPDFPMIDEFAFDLSDVRALQEDVDEIHARIRQDYNAGLITQEEARVAIGSKARPDEPGTFLLPINLTPVSSDEFAAGDVREVIKGLPQGGEGQDLAQAPTPEPASGPAGG